MTYDIPCLVLGATLAVVHTWITFRIGFHCGYWHRVDIEKSARGIRRTTAK